MTFPTAADEKAMMQQPSRWIHWPFLPLKKRNMETAVLVALSLKGNTSKFLANQNLWMLPRGEELKQLVEAAPATDADQLVAEGWLVD